MQNVDVAIVGGGMVGLALACGLQGSGLRVAVLEQKQPQPVAPDAPPELRVSAINAASEKLLTHLGVWADIVAQRASCYHGMEVWDKDSFGHIAFDDESMGYSHLGHIVENAVIHHALWQKAQQCSDVTLIAPAQIQQVAWGENEAFITLQSGDMLTARLVVGADGANSWLRNKADIPLTFWDYRHHALVATIRTEEPHGGVARQIFHNDGILAFLPLADPHLCSIVWSLVPEKAQLMEEATPDAFNQALCMAFDNRLGLCTLESERQVFPLTGRYARQFAAHRLALVGDAAHTIHPVAGQGFNLCMRDAYVLRRYLMEQTAKGADLGEAAMLQHYEQSRLTDQRRVIKFCDSVVRGFSNQNPVLKLIRNTGLLAFDTIPGIKPLVANYAMGLKA